MSVHHSVTLAIDVMFINKVAFLITTSRSLKFGTVEAIANHQVTAIITKLRLVCQVYHHRGFQVSTILRDPEFEPIRATFPQLNCCAADEHVPDVERYIRTVKDCVRSTYRMLPFKRIPCLILIHLVKNAVFWLNALPAMDGVSPTHSPRYILTGHKLEYPLHVRLEFGEYVQTHEKHGNRMTDRTLGAICLGPNGNSQGGHYFMCLSNGTRIMRDRWTDLPMPREVISRVTELGRQQGMLATLTFADRHGHELEDQLVEVPDDDSSHEEYDPYYDDDSTSTGDDDLSYDTDDDADDDDDDDDAGHIPNPVTNDHHDVIAAVPAAPVLDNDSVLFGPGDPPIGEADEEDHLTNPDQEPQDLPDDLMSTGVVENDDDDPTGVEEELGSEVDETTGVEDDLNSEDDNTTGVGEKATPVMETCTDEELLDDDDTHPITESHKFQQAVSDGVSRAHEGNIQRPTRRHTRKVKDPAFEYMNLIFKEMEPQTVFTMLMEQDSTEMLSFITEQMSTKRGLKQFGTAGADAIMKELRQLIYRKVMEGRKSGDLTTAQKKAALKYLMFLKQK